MTLHVIVPANNVRGDGYVLGLEFRRWMKDNKISWSDVEFADSQCDNILFHLDDDDKKAMLFKLTWS